jgi:hypothetical protein
MGDWLALCPRPLDRRGQPHDRELAEPLITSGAGVGGAPAPLRFTGLLRLVHEGSPVTRRIAVAATSLATVTGAAVLALAGPLAFPQESSFSVVLRSGSVR